MDIEKEILKEVEIMTEKEKKDFLEYARFKNQSKGKKPNKTLGLFKDDVEFIDNLVYEAMKTRENMSFRNSSNV
jgi:hypothetical protein